MDFEQKNKYDDAAIAITNDIKEKIPSYVPSDVKAIDKRNVKDDIYSVRVEVIIHEQHNCSCIISNSYTV